MGEGIKEVLRRERGFFFSPWRGPNREEGVHCGESVHCAHQLPPRPCTAFTVPSPPSHPCTAFTTPSPPPPIQPSLPSPHCHSAFTSHRALALPSPHHRPPASALHALQVLHPRHSRTLHRRPTHQHLHLPLRAYNRAHCSSASTASTLASNTLARPAGAALRPTARRHHAIALLPLPQSPHQTRMQPTLATACRHTLARPCTHAQHTAARAAAAVFLLSLRDRPPPTKSTGQ
jgi:hypothetical protein